VIHIDGKGDMEITNGPDDARWAPDVRRPTIRDCKNNQILLESF